MTNKKIESIEKPKGKLPQTDEKKNLVLTLIGLVLSVTLLGIYYFLKTKQDEIE